MGLLKIISQYTRRFFGAVDLSQTSNGLLLKDYFSAANGWAGSNWSEVAEPAFMASPRSPIPAQLPSGVDAGGVREGHLFIDDDGTWYLYYDAGDGDAGDSSGYWRVQLAVSTNRGLTWTKTGHNNIDLQKTNNPGDGSWQGRAILCINKFDSLYYMVMMSSSTSIETIPRGPYEADQFTGPTPMGPWTFNRRALVVGGTGAFDETGSYSYSIVRQGSNYTMFFNASGFADGWAIGMATATNPAGPWTKGTADIMDDAIVGDPENPSVLFHTPLNKWAMVYNAVAADLSKTDKNGVSFSSSLTDWTTGVKRLNVQRICEADGVGAIGVITPFQVPESSGIVVDGGYVPAVFDADPEDSTFHRFRKLFYSVLEPSAKCARFTPVAGVHRYTKNFVHDDFTAEFGFEIKTLAGGGYIGLDYRMQAGGDSYRLIALSGGGLKLQKSSGGTFSNVQTSIGDQVTEAIFMHRVKIQVVGNSHKAWLDGELQIDTTDSTFAAGVKIATVATAINADIRLLHFRSSDAVTITGVTPGATVVLRSFGGIPIEKVEAVSDTVIFEPFHFPVSSIEINGTDFVIDGGIWGGDTFEVTNV